MLGRSKWAEMKSVRFSFLWGLESPGMVLRNAAEKVRKSLLEVTVAPKVTPLLEISGLHQTRT